MEDETRIVVVDDVADAAMALHDLLRDGGYQVRTANSGEQALQLVQQWQPDCVLFDINMPGINGLELTQKLRALYGTSLVLIAVTGGEETDPVVKQTFDLVDFYLHKPDYLKGLMQVFPPLKRHTPKAM